MGNRRGGNRGKRNQTQCLSNNQDRFQQQDDRGFDGPRSSSRSSLRSENNGGVDQQNCEIHIPSNFGGSRASSHISIRSNYDQEKERNFNAEEDRLSLGGSRCSSRAQLFSENIDRGGGDNHRGEINIPFNGSRTASLANIPSSWAKENESNLNLQDARGIGGSRYSSRSRLSSENSTREDDHQSQVNIPFNFTGSRASSRTSMLSNYIPEEENNLDGHGEHISIRGSRCSSRSRQLSEDKDRYENNQSEINIPFNCDRSRASSRASIRSNYNPEDDNNFKGQDGLSSIGGSRCSSRVRLNSENMGQGDIHYSQNTVQLAGSRAASLVNIPSDYPIGDDDQSNLPDPLHDRLSLSGSRFSSRTDCSTTNNRPAQSISTGRDMPPSFAGSRTSSQFSVRSNFSVNNRNHLSQPDQRSDAGSHYSSHSRLLSERNINEDQMDCNEINIPSNVPSSRASSHASIGHGNVLSDGNTFRAQDECASDSRFYTRADFPTVNIELSEQQDDFNAHSNLEHSRATSNVIYRSNHDLESENNFHAQDELPSLYRGRTSSNQAHYATENEGNFNQQDERDFCGSRYSSRSRLHSDSNSQYEDHYSGNKMPSKFTGSRASSHISVRSHHGYGSEDDFYSHYDQRYQGERQSSSRNRLVSNNSWEDRRNSICSNASGVGNETDNNIRLAQINSYKESHSNLFPGSENSHISVRDESLYQNTSRISMVNEHRKLNGSDQHSISSNEFENANRAYASNSNTQDEVPVPLCSTNAMTPIAKSRVVNRYAQSPSVFEETQVEAVSHLPPKAHYYMMDKELPQNTQSDSSMCGPTTPARPKSSRNSAVSSARNGSSSNSQRVATNYSSQSDTSTIEQLSDVSYGSAYKWNVRDPKSLDRSRSGPTDAKYEQKSRDPGRTVRHNVKPGMIRHLASIFDQKDVLGTRQDAASKTSLDRKSNTGLSGANVNRASVSHPRDSYVDQDVSIPSSYRSERADYRRTTNAVYNGIQDAYIDVSQDSDDSYATGSATKNNDVNKRYNLREERDHFSRIEEDIEDRCETSSHYDYLGKGAAKFDQSHSSDIRQLSNFGRDSRNPSSSEFQQNYEEKKRFAEGKGQQPPYQEIVESHPVSYAHTHNNWNSGKPSFHQQKSSNSDILRSGSHIGKEANTEDMADDNFNGHIDHLFGFVKDHDSQYNDVESVCRSSNRGDVTERRGLSRSVSKYREMQRTKRAFTGEAPVKFTPASVPNVGQLAPNRSDYKKTLTIENRMVALATSTPRASPHCTTRDVNANYDDSFLSSITDGSRCHEKYTDHRQQINKLHHALDMTATQIGMTERVLLQARKEKKPLQELAAQRTLLVSKERVKLIQKELRNAQELSNIRRQPPPLSRDVRGSMLISDIIVHLNPRFYNERNADSNYSFAFVVVLKCGCEVEATSPVTIQSQSQYRLRQLHFFEKINFGNLPMAFEVQLEVYYMVIPDNNGDVSCAANLANKCRNIFSAGRKDRFKDGMSVGEFSRCGYLLLSRDTTSKTTFYLDSAEYPLESTIEVRSRCSDLPPSIEVDFRGFLTMCQYISGIGSWERYWAVLRRGCIYFWRYPDDESLQRDPKARLELTTCIRDMISPCNPEQCPRPYSFSMDVLVPIGTSLMDRKRILLCADSADHMDSWLSAINETLSIIRGQ